MRELSLFTGAGLGLIGTHALLGWRCVAAVEIEEYPRAVLLQRQADGILPRFPIWDDIRTFDGKPWRGRVDVISGGFPCQDISAAGKGEGITGSRSGLWSEMARIVGEVRPRFVLVENSPLLVSRGIDTVLSDLAEMGLDAEWGVIGAHHAGAPQQRDRIWVLAHTDEARLSSTIRGELGGVYSENGSHKGGQFGRRATKERRVPWWYTDPADLPDTEDEWILLRQRGGADGERPSRSGTDRRDNAPEHEGREWWPIESRVGRVVNGCPDRVDRIKAIGNGQVPAVAALAWHILSQRIGR